MNLPHFLRKKRLENVGHLNCPELQKVSTVRSDGIREASTVLSDPSFLSWMIAGPPT
jgi:hypothetical protein